MPDEVSRPHGAETLARADLVPPTVDVAILPGEADRLPVVPRATYEVVGEFARGGMGRVLLARDRRLGRSVALKELRPGAGGEGRFVREALVTARLQHPSIIPVYEAGRWPDGTAFYAMKMVTGRSLEALFREAPTLPARLALLPHVLAVAEAIAYAHSERVVHRDLKPANVLVGPFGETVVVDWGLAKDLGRGLEIEEGHDPLPATLPPEAGSDDRTVVGTVLGTPHFMAPEQARGLPVDERADVYSLGAILYQLLTGAPPHAGKTLKEALAAAASERPEAVEALATEAPAELVAVVKKAMSLDPADRYPSARELAEDLRRYATGQLVSAHHYSPAEHLRRFARRHRAALAVATVLTAGLLVTLAWGLYSTKREARIAAEERDRARREATRAEQVNAFVQGMLASADPRQAGRKLAAVDMLAEAARRTEAELESEPEIQASVRTTLGTTYQGLGLLEPAEKLLQAALDTRRALLGRDHADVARSLGRLAALKNDQGDLARAEALYREALATWDRLGASTTADAVTAAGDLAGVLRTLGHNEEAERLLRTSLERERELWGEGSSTVAAALNNLAVLLGQRGEWQEAEKLHREALAILRGIHGGDHVEVASALTTLASSVEAQGRLAEAEPLFREALAMRQKILGPSHPEVAWTTYNYAFLLRRKGDAEGALRLSREVLALRGEILPDTHPMVAAALQVEGLSLMDLGRPKPAEPLLRESLALRRKALPEGHWLLWSSVSVLGECLLAQGRMDAAEPLLRQGYDGLRAAQGDSHERTIEARQRLDRLEQARKKAGVRARAES